MRSTPPMPVRISMPRRENTPATPSDTTPSSPPRMRGGADDHDRGGQALHRPHVAVGEGVFGAGKVHPPRVAAGAHHELLARHAGAVPERERVVVREPGVTGPVHDARARRFELLSELLLLLDL